MEGLGHPPWSSPGIPPWGWGPRWTLGSASLSPPPPSGGPGPRGTLWARGHSEPEIPSLTRPLPLAPPLRRRNLHPTCHTTTAAAAPPAATTRWPGVARSRARASGPGGARRGPPTGAVAPPPLSPPELRGVGAGPPLGGGGSPPVGACPPPASPLADPGGGSRIRRRVPGRGPPRPGRPASRRPGRRGPPALDSHPTSLTSYCRRHPPPAGP